MRAVVLGKYERLALEFLARYGGGFTAGTIARNSGHGQSRSQMAQFRAGTLNRLYLNELVEKIDAEKPAVYVITDLGRAALRTVEPKSEGA